MTRVSKTSLDKDIHGDVMDSFVVLLSDLGKKAEIREFLNDFLTKEEKLMLSKRLVLALMLREGYSSNEIQDVLKVSRTTINLMKHWLAYKKGVGIGIEKLISIERRSDSNGKVDSILKHLPPLTRSKKDMARWPR